MSRFALTAERVFDGEVMREDAVLIVEGARIDDVVARSAVDPGLSLRDLGAGLLAPGFIDLQVNGGGGVLLNQTPTVEGVRAIAEAHRNYGVTGLLPTVITDAPEVMRAAAHAVSDAIAQGAPGVLGIHIEGPFIDPKRKGAHDERFIRRPTSADIDWLTSLKCGRILLTVAPNMVEWSTIRRLTKAGITVSLGHSDASAAEAYEAMRAGARGFTHLFNAMSQLSGRAPGMVGAALASAAYCGMIADGRHVDVISLHAAIKALSPRKAFFVSDAMPSAAGGPDQYTLQGRAVRLINDRLELADGTLAGANITMLDAVRNGIGPFGFGYCESLRMATLTPAEFIGLDSEVGRIRPGQRANLVHIGNGLNVLETWIDGVSSIPEPNGE